jgi:hypothetical protein
VPFSIPSIRFSHIFHDLSGTPYLFALTLGRGAESVAQFVLHHPSGTPLVRRVPHRRLTDDQVAKRSRESTILSLVKAALKRKSLTNEDVKIVQVFAEEDIPTPWALPSDPGLWYRAAYMPYYNGGDLSAFKRKFTNPGSAGVPRYVVLTLLAQVLRALDFLLRLEPTPVLHGDLHGENIFLNWKDDSPVPEFVVADLGMARILDKDKAARGEYDPRAFFWGGDVDMLVHTHARSLLAIPKLGGREVVPDGHLVEGFDHPDFIDALRKIVAMVEAASDELQALLDDEERTTLPEYPSLLPAVALAEAALAAHPLDLHDPRMWSLRQAALGAEPPRAEPRPLTYNTKAAASAACGVHGPWRIARVDVADDGSVRNVERVFSQVHSRPNGDNELSDSETGEVARREGMEGRGVRVRKMKRLEEESTDDAVSLGSAEGESQSREGSGSPEGENGNGS